MQDDIIRKLQGMSGWKLGNDSISKQFLMENFLSGSRFLLKIADMSRGFSPSATLTDDKLIITLIASDRAIELAKKIDEMYENADIQIGEENSDMDYGITEESDEDSEELGFEDDSDDGDGD